MKSKIWMLALTVLTVFACTSNSERTSVRQSAVSGPVVLAASTHMSFNFNTSFRSPLPAGTQAGDQLLEMISIINSAAATTVITPPDSSWVLVSRQNSAAESNISYAIYRHTATANEPSLFTFTLNRSFINHVALLDVRGASATTPIAAMGTQAAFGGGWVSQSLTSPQDGSLLVVGIQYSGNAYTTPTGMARIDEDQMSILTQGVNAGPTGTRSAGSNADWLTVDLVLSPDAPSGDGGTGASGSAGMAGAAGNAGSAGTAGASGASGSAGTAGASGVSGSAGTAGASGSAGTAGASGSAGTAGASGSAGAGGVLIFSDDFSAPEPTRWHIGSRPDESGVAFLLNTNITTDTANGLKLLTTQVDNVMPGYSYTSAAMQTPFSYLYGTLEVVAKFPGGTGTWPSIWMLGDNCRVPHLFHQDDGEDPNCNWPNPGGDEIDVAEILQSNRFQVNQQIHRTGSGDPSCLAQTPDVSAAFHTYRLVWAPGSLVWQIDGNTTCTASGSVVANTPMFVLINTQVGGAGGTPNPSTLPQTFSVDSVKIWQ